MENSAVIILELSEIKIAPELTEEMKANPRLRIIKVTSINSLFRELRILLQHTNYIVRIIIADPALKNSADLEKKLLCVHRLLPP